jgi:hypothetical protein
MLTSLASHLTAATKCKLWIKLSWGPWKHSTVKRLKNGYQIGELIGNAHKRATAGEIAANGFRATGLFPCDKNIFRPYDFPLSSKDKDAAPVNHSALIKDQRSDIIQFY